jgi:hypothetical protein
MATARRDLAWLGGLCVALLVVFVWPYAIDGHRFGVGPDVPVYLWWTRVGAGEGLSLVGSRPGAPALVAALAGALQLNVTAVTAGLASALGVAVGAASAALVRRAARAAEMTWLLAGLLAGVFSVHLVAGYLANLLVAVTFLAAAACLAGPRRAWWAAALLLAGGGLAHPPFLIHAIVVLAGAAALAWRADAREEARDIALAITLGGLVAGAGVLATIAGPGPIAAETSKDGYLRRAGLDRQLVDAYRERFRLRAARYVQWISVPLAVAGASVADRSVAGGFLRRLLTSWLAVIAIGIPVGYVTGWLPPDRLVTFGFAVPIAAALGLMWLRGKLGARPLLARAAILALVTWMVVGALLAWGRQASFVSVPEARQAIQAARIIQEATNSHLVPPGTPIVVPVDDGDPTSTFLSARAANVVRAALPPSRADDVYVFVGTVTDLFAGRPTVRGDGDFDALSELTLAAIPDEPEPVVIVLPAFYLTSDAASDPRLFGPDDGVLSSVEGPFTPMPVESDDDPIGFGTSSGMAIALSTIAILATLAVLGLGYARSLFDDAVTAAATAPAFGAAAVTLAAVALDRIGLRLESVPVALAASVLAGLGGFAAFLVVQRQGDREAPA